MPHSYGASFSGVGFLGATRYAPITLTAPNPAPSASMIRIGIQPCMAYNRPALVNVFSSAEPGTVGNDQTDDHPAEDFAAASTKKCYHTPVPSCPFPVLSRFDAKRRA